MRVTRHVRRGSDRGRRLAFGGGRDDLEERNIKENAQTTPRVLTSSKGIIATAGMIVIFTLRGESQWIASLSTVRHKRSKKTYVFVNWV